MKKVFIRGLLKENPVLVALLGLCSVLAVSNTAINSLFMSGAVMFVLVFSSLIISSIRKIIPNQVRIPCFIVVIATFVTIADLFLKAYFPEISKNLGPFVPLIVVNCIILARQEAFASKNPVHYAVADAFGMAIGYAWVIITLGIIRELLGFGTIFGHKVLGSWFEPWVVMLLPPGAFITLGVIVGIMRWLQAKFGGSTS
ncbi:MAG: electron transport complex subunit RsxE [Candidatus Hydrothermota bacterium]|nr:MAG: electron transport complex subunit RsxE [Candidatus Hydrothermae bacterium]